MPETVLGTGAKCCGQDCGVRGCAPEKAEIVEDPALDAEALFGVIDDDEEEDE